MKKKQIESTLNLIQSYYRLLHIGAFLENYMKQNDLSDKVTDLSLQTGKQTSFSINKGMVKKFLKQIHNNPDKKNIYGHITQITAFRQITSNYRELIKQSGKFRNFLYDILNDQYVDFEQLIKFIRNVLSHTMSHRIELNKDDYIHQKTYLKSHGTNTIKFDMTYSKYIKKYWKGDKDYGFSVHIDFNNLKPGMNFLEVVSFHELCMLCEFCFNLTEIFKSRHLN